MVWPEASAFCSPLGEARQYGDAAMTRPLRRNAVGYVVAVVITSLAVLLRWLLAPSVGEALPLLTLFGAVAAAVWLGGYRPALLATVVGYLAWAYFFIKPRGTFGLTDARSFVAVLAYLLTCAIIIGLGEGMRVAQRRTREGQERLQTTLASIGDAVITTDTEGRVTNMNAMAESLTGWTCAEAVGRPLESVFNIVNEETRQPAGNLAKRALGEGAIVGLANHTVLIRRDGTERPIDDSAAPVRDAHGDVLGCVLVFRDVTERRRAEQQLADDAARLESIVNHILDGIVTIDESGTVQSLNPAAEKLFGYRAAEVAGQNVKMLMPDAYRLRHDDYLANYLRTGQAKVIGIGREVEGRRQDGSTFPIDLAVSEFWWGKRRYFTGLVRDISERKRAEADLHRLNAELQSRVSELQAILEVLPIGVAIAHDPDCRRITLNPFNSEMLGLPAGANASLSAPADERPTTYAMYRDGKELTPDELPMQLAARGVEVRDFEIDLVRAGRSTLRLLCYAQPLLDSEGRIGGSVGAFLDITEIKRIEQALRDADRRKNEFLATLAHELRNPLAPIRNAVHVLLMKGPPEPDLKWSREVIDRQMQHVSRLLDDLLDVARITHNKLELRKERVSLSAVIHSAVETSRPLIDGSRQELTVALLPEPVYVDADPVRLAQVFSNLLNNAAKYTEPGGHLRLACERQGSDVVVSVKDDGVGIAHETLPRIFEMFSQSERTLDRSQQGLGIGLSLVKGLVELHGGSIEARSDGPGKGSEFLVRLPVVVEPLVEQAGPPSEDVLPQRVTHRRLLVVDDLKDGADSLAMLLRVMGHEVRTAYDGDEAILAAESFRPDVILLDIGMPKLNGYEACRRIREQPWGAQICLVALTGWGQQDDHRRAEQAGFNHHLLKPVNLAALLKVLAELKTSDHPLSPV